MPLERKVVETAANNVQARSNVQIAPEDRWFWAFSELVGQLKNVTYTITDAGLAPDFNDPRVAQLYEDCKEHKHSL
jgi:hypothetical protein